MKYILSGLLLASLTLTSLAEGKVRLFLLSGQSNMVGIDAERDFAPLVRQAFPSDEIVAVRYAVGGRSISSWVKDWQPLKEGDKSKGIRALYTATIDLADKELAGRKPDTVTWVWMQGEADAKFQYAAAYERALPLLLKQLQETYGRQDIDFVLGRLSDFGINNPRYPDWEKIREIQVKFAEADPERRAWVDTDAFNETGDGLHYNAEGRVKLARRFAEEAVRLIKDREARAGQNGANQ